MADPVDVLVVGGGLGGVAAATAAASFGLDVLLIESTGWLGGQLTAQGVCTPDEAAVFGVPSLKGVAVVETCGATYGYQTLRQRIREWYRANVGLSAAGAAQSSLDVGGCWVNFGFAVEPSVAVGVLAQILQEQTTLDVWMGAKAIGVARDGAAVSVVTIAKADGTTVDVAPGYVLDATETGDLAAAAGLATRIGAEAKADTGEPDAPDEAHPEWIQPITYPIALTHRTDGGDYTIPKPDDYDAVKASQGFTLVDGAITQMFGGAAPFWTYRRVVESALFTDPGYRFDVATINVGSNDYRGTAYPTGDAATDRQILLDAQSVSRCYLYWLQTEAPRDGGGQGFPELQPNDAFWGTGDYLAPQPYIRESRRIVGTTTVKQGDIDADYAPGPRARLFSDACGVGNYPMDVHAGVEGMPQIESFTRPYQVPTGALVPLDCPNLLAAGKCLGVTHLTNGAYRLHPQEWNVGESAGTLAAFCLQGGVAPADVLASPDGLLVGYQAALLARRVPIFWWSDVTADLPEYAAIHLAGVRGVFDGDPDSLDFRPHDALPAEDRAEIEARAGDPLPWPEGTITRAQTAQLVATHLGWI